mmetsp:Transcript_66172/g.123511  ORF Transcript_66172/g.123511 Transcript_66172/m.123511 type:complete len:226 (-) Transcript_66172:225-902(-)
MQFLIGRSPSSNVLEMPDMMPRLMLCSRPKGFPIAYTVWPTSSSEDLPLGSGDMGIRRFVGFSTFTTAMSVAVSDPTTSPRRTSRRVSSSPVFVSRKTMSMPPSPMSLTTWLLVTMWFSSQTKPLPTEGGFSESCPGRFKEAAPGFARLATATTPGVDDLKTFTASLSSAVLANAKAGSAGPVPLAPATIPAITASSFSASATEAPHWRMLRRLNAGSRCPALLF